MSRHPRRSAFETSDSLRDASRARVTAVGTDVAEAEPAHICRPTTRVAYREAPMRDCAPIALPQVLPLGAEELIR